MMKVSRNNNLNILIFTVSLLSLMVFLALLINERSFPNKSQKPKTVFVSPSLKPSLTPAPQFSLIVAGDVMLARSVTARMRELEDFAFPLLPIASLLKEADLTLVNLEAPFGADCPTLQSGMVFCADHRGIEALIRSGVDLVSLANNHALDQKEAGLIYTKELLAQNYLTPIGLREPYFVNVKGIRVAFLAYNSVLPNNETLISWAYPDQVVSEINRYQSQGDLLIVYFHWGEEYVVKPQAGGAGVYDPQKLAHLAIDAGADLILGSHPHVIQPTEVYQDKLIIYSFGNFVFDQDWSQATQKGQVGKFIFNHQGLVDYQLWPVSIIDYQPRLTAGS